MWEQRADELVELMAKGYTNRQIAEHYGCTLKTVKNQLGILRKKKLIGYRDTPPKPDNYKESLDINKDGSYISDKPLWMTLDQVKDPEYLMKAHGFEPSAWELVSARNNIWNTSDKIHGIQTLYASKITVKPKVNHWTLDDLVSAIKSSVDPVHIETTVTPIDDRRMLEIALYDAHFGNATYEDYKETQHKIHDLLNSKRWDETLFVIGSDLFHADNFKSTTVSGTQLETVDIPNAWNDCSLFYDALIVTALQQSNTVKIVYIPGNHDQSLGWCFAQYLKVKYSQAVVDDRVKERKVVTYHSNFLGLAHGDKARKDLIRIFPAEFPIEWSQTTSRQVHIGHLHREEEVRGKDEFGLTIRTLSTRNPTDAWHDANGYVTAHRHFMLFEYDTATLRHIHYV